MRRLVLVVLVVITSAGCGVDRVEPTASPAASAPPPVAAPVSAKVGEFLARCPFSHRSPDDPLVHPHGETSHDAHAMSAGPPHSHDFFGNTTTDEHTTIASLATSRSTTCDLAEDLSSYWAPTLYRGGEVVAPDEFVAYYDTAPGVDPTGVAPLPHGLSMIAGNDTRPDAPDVHAAGWTCGRSREIAASVPTCRFGAPLTARITFPDCWNGRDVAGGDHRSHVAYSTDGACPSTHPVPIVRLVLRVRYPIYGDPSDLTLSSGPLATAHADFMNAWEEGGMRELVDVCIRRHVVCGVA